MVRISLFLTLSFLLSCESSPSIWKFPCGANVQEKKVKEMYLDYFRTNLEYEFSLKYDCILDGRARIIKQMSLKPEYFKEGVFLDLVILHGKMGSSYSFLKWDEWMSKLKDWAVNSNRNKKKKLEVGCAMLKKSDYEILCLLQTHGSILKRIYQDYYNISTASSSSNKSKLE
ncbi:unnamed protein product [Cylicocyclus nassatus]|uniref:Uncharacterized protein n=1 Tax=Cylicocyclus nassatus TaxID=53992 RepID=A0AA36GNC6_CYLNA|nr:unnamed protein product [Cylicocyclus nassatus]